MKCDHILDAIGTINDEAIRDAKVYQPTKQRFFLWSKWRAIAACFVLVASVMGIISMFNQSGTLPFVLTAYAMGTENEIVGNVMELGKSIPISTINTSTGKKCFVFSCDKSSYEADSSITILMQENLFNDTTISTEKYNSYNLSEFEELALDPTQHYFIAILGDQNAVAADMYSFPLYVGDNANNIKTQKYSILIMESENGYTALLADER